MDESDIQEIIQLAEKNRMLIFVDETFALLLRAISVEFRSFVEVLNQMKDGKKYENV